MKRILIIGSKGMAGHLLYYYLKESGKYLVFDISRDNSFFESSYCLDLTNTGALDNIINEIHPDIVINCAGILNQEAENNPDKAILINSYLPHFLNILSLKYTFRLIHLSTDCVFSGKKGSYKVNDLPDGIGYYALSKGLGEINESPHLTMRTSIVGPELKKTGIGLFHWFMQQTGEIKGYKNVLWTGVTTIALAKSVENAIDNNLSGLFHLVNNTTISKYNLLILFKNIFHKDAITILPYSDYTSDKSLVRNDDVFEIGTYEDMISEMKEWMDSHKYLYPAY